MAKFRHYSKYADSRTEWMGEIPVHWTKGRVGDLAKIVNGYPFDSAQFSPTAGIPLVRIRDINSRETEVFYNGTPVATAEINDDDVLIGMDGDFNVAWWNGGKALLNQRVACIRGRSLSWQRFIYYSLPFSLRVTNDLTYYTTVKHLSSIDIKKAHIAVPPETELVTITAFLDHETAKIDRLIARQKRLIELLKEKRQAVISNAVTKGLNPDAPMKDSGVEWLGEVPAHWPVIKLGYFAKVLNGSTPDRNNVEYWEDGDVPWLSSSALNDYHITSQSEFITRKALAECSVSIIPHGSVLVGLVGQGKTRGLSALLNIDATINQNIAAVLPRKDRLSSRFLHLFLHSIYEPLRDFGRGGNQAALNNELVAVLRMVLPTKDEQDDIVKHIEGRLSVIDLLMHKAQHSIDLMQEHRTALISAAVTGKIDVRGWQKPNTEPQAAATAVSA